MELRDGAVVGNSGIGIVCVGGNVSGNVGVVGPVAVGRRVCVNSRARARARGGNVNDAHAKSPVALSMVKH